MFSDYVYDSVYTLVDVVLFDTTSIDLVNYIMFIDVIFTQDGCP
jgi:hypothetical protein